MLGSKNIKKVPTVASSNVPFFMAGAIATLALVVSGVFVIAPYVEFLSPIAVIGVPLPVILILFALSTAVIVLLYKIISLDRASQQIDNFATKGEVEILREEVDKAKELADKISQQTNNFATKCEMKILREEVDEAKELAESALERGKVTLEMQFYAVNEERFGELSGMFLTKNLKTLLNNICNSQGGSNPTQGYVFYGLPGTGKTHCH